MRLQLFHSAFCALNNKHKCIAERIGLDFETVSLMFNIQKGLSWNIYCTVRCQIHCQDLPFYSLKNRLTAFTEDTKTLPGFDLLLS